MTLLPSNVLEPYCPLDLRIRLSSVNSAVVSSTSPIDLNLNLKPSDDIDGSVCSVDDPPSPGVQDYLSLFKLITFDYE